MPNTIPCGYHGRYLRIDVSAGHAVNVPLPPSVLRQSLGGSGLGVHLLLEEGQAGTGALAPKAPIAFVFSPLVGSPLTTSAKFAVVSKSPLTQRLNDSLASSGFAIRGKQTGHDAIMIVGQSASPAVVVVDNDRFRLDPAGDLWGLPIDQAQTQLRARYGPDFRFAVIGPAGEHLVHYATVSHDGRHAGRGGSGAVLGAKNIKAVAVRGDQRCQWAQPERLADCARELSRRSFGPATAKYRELGTASNLLVFNRLQALPTRNFQQGSFAGAENLAPETMLQTRRKTRASCAACTIGCEHIYALREAASSTQEAGVRLEYESLFALGPLCGIDDADAVLAAARRCDQLGLDTISLGGTLAFAMECAQRGWLDLPELQFGDGSQLVPWIERIAVREGFGDRLANGSRRLAEELGPAALAIAPQVKGLELPGYEPRVLQTMALGFAVGTRGADHNRSSAYEIDFSSEGTRGMITEQNVLQAIAAEDRAALMDSLILCRFLRGVFSDFFEEAAQMLNLVTGWDLSADELQETARRIMDAKKRFNIAAGWTPQEDTLPDRFLDTPLPGAEPLCVSRQQLTAAIRDYNIARGWTPDGWLPPPASDPR